MSKTILVVEDQEDNRQILRDLLASAGFRMIEAWDGKQALTVARSQQPDLILMDIQLPILDGYEATRSIKRDPKLKHIPIIAVTSYALSGDETRAREAGCVTKKMKCTCPERTLGLGDLEKANIRIEGVHYVDSVSLVLHLFLTARLSVLQGV